MSDWTTVRIGQHTSIVPGFPFDSKLFDEENGVPLVRIRDLLEGETETNYNGPYDDTYLVHRGDILVGMDGDFNIARWKGTSALLNQRMLKISDRPRGKIHAGYLFYFLAPFLVEVNNKTSATTVKHLSTYDISDADISVPPLPQQRKIAAILTTVDNLIEKTEVLIAKYQAIKQGMMHDLFTRGIDQHGHLRPPYDEAPELYKQSELGWIPKEWGVKRLAEFTEIIRGASPRPKSDPRYYGGTVPRLMVEDVTRDGKYVTPQIDFLTHAGARLSRPMPAGSLTVVCSGTVGIPAFLAVDACIHDGFLGVRRIANICLAEYLYYTFTNLKQKLDTSATHGGIFTNLTTDIVKDFVIALPPIAEQTAMARETAALDQVLSVEEKTLEKHRRLKTGLMQDLLTGKVRVNVDEDEDV